MNPWSEALLWIQLLGLAALPLEVLLLLVLFAGADPGPVPALERLLVWGLGALLPALLLWKRPPDVWSLLMVQVPLRGRRPQQQRLSALQAGLGLQVARATGAALLLPLSWWADQQAGLATGLSPFGASGRLVVLLLSVPLLALMLWQWQQLVQALRLLSLPGPTVEAATPLTLAELEQSRLSLGLPLLLLNPLRLDPPMARPPQPPSVPVQRPVATELPLTVEEQETSASAERSLNDQTNGALSDPVASTANTLPEHQPIEPNDGIEGSELHPPGDRVAHEPELEATSLPGEGETEPDNALPEDPTERDGPLQETSEDRLSADVAAAQAAGLAASGLAVEVGLPDAQPTHGEGPLDSPEAPDDGPSKEPTAFSPERRLMDPASPSIAVEPLAPVSRFPGAPGAVQPPGTPTPQTISARPPGEGAVVITEDHPGQAEPVQAPKPAPEAPEAETRPDGHEH